MTGTSISDVNNYRNLKYNSNVLGVIHRGVIEDNNDPDKLGRVKVRVFGVHASNDILPTSNLPWSPVLTSANLGLVTGVGLSAILEQGNYVWVIFEDNDHNRPIVLGTISGIYRSSPVEFKDKDNKYPLPDRLNESDINRLTRSEKYTETPLAIRDNYLQSYNASGSSWTELQTLSKNAVYPYNKVIETRTGHVIEIDDTDGNERILIFHKSGTCYEVRPDGTMTTHIVNDSYTTVEGSLYLGINGNSSTNIKGNENFQTNGNRSGTINGSDSLHVGGTKDTIVSGNYTLQGANIFLN